MSAAPQIGPDGVTFSDGTIQSTAAPTLLSISTAIVLANTQMKTYVDSKDTTINSNVTAANVEIDALRANIIAANTAIAGTSAVGSIQIFTSSGSWTAPAGVTKVKATVVGGGGGGNGGSAPNPTSGGAGGVAIGVYTVVPGTTYNIVIGSGGTGVSGGNGGTSSFDAFCSATGGAGGTNAGSGAAGGGSGGNLRNTYVHGGVTGIMSGTDYKEVSSPAQAWSINSSFSPGAGTGTEDGGVGGAVMLEY